MSNCSDTRIQVSIVAEDTHYAEEVVSTEENEPPEVQPVVEESEHTQRVIPDEVEQPEELPEVQPVTVEPNKSNMPHMQ